MSNLAMHVQHQLNVFAAETLHRFIGTGDYQEQDYKLLHEMIISNHMFLSEHAQWHIDPKWFDRYKAASQLLADKLNRTNANPLGGDAVYVRCENGTIYEDALISFGEDNSGTKGKVSVVTRGGGHLVDLQQSAEDSLKMVYAGGYAKGVKADEFTGHYDTVLKSFWFWADTPKRNGGIYITRPVRRWHLKAINPDFY